MASGRDTRAELPALDLADRRVAPDDDYEAPTATEQGPAERLTLGPTTRTADSPTGTGYNDLE